MSESSTDSDENTKTLIGVNAQKRLLLKLIQEEDQPCSSENVLSEQRWEKLTAELNQLGGVSKSSLQWQKTYSFIRQKVKSHKLKSCNKKTNNTESTSCNNDTNYELFITCGDSNEDIQRFKKDGKYCMQIIHQIGNRLISERKTEEECLTELCKGKSANCKRIQIWQILRKITKIKLDYLLKVHDKDTIAEPARLTTTEWFLFDTVLAHQDVDVIGMVDGKMVDMPILWDLFYLVNKFNVESLSGDKSAEAWLEITTAYKEKKRLCSPMLLQRRWYQMKLATKTVFNKHKEKNQTIERDSKTATDSSPTVLQKALAEKYESLFTGEFVVWEDLIKLKRVILREQFDQIALDKNNQEISTNFELKADMATISLTDSESETEENVFIKNIKHKDIDRIANNKKTITSHVTETKTDIAVIPDTAKASLKDTPKIALPHQQGKIPLYILPPIHYTSLLGGPNPVLPGSSNPVLPDLSNPVLPGVTTPVLTGLSNPVLPGISNPVLPGPSNPVLPGISHPVLPGFSKPVLPGLSNPLLPGAPKPVLPGVSNPVLPSVSNLPSVPNSVLPNIPKLLLPDKPVLHSHPNILFNSLIKGQPAENNLSNCVPSRAVLNIKTECQMEMKNDTVHVDTDNLILLDNGLELNEEDSTDTDMEDPIGCSERGLEEDINKKQNENVSTIEQLTKVPIVYTVKLEDMNLLPPNFSTIISNKQILTKIYKKSKPKFRDRKPNLFEKVSISSKLFKKPRQRSYDSTKLFNNPDFNVSLLGLKPNFFSIPRNRSFFKSCKPMTVDVSKEFEKSLVDGIMYLKDNDYNAYSDIDSRKETPISTLKSYQLKPIKDINEMIDKHDNKIDKAKHTKTIKPTSEIKELYNSPITKYRRKNTTTAVDSVNTYRPTAPQQTSNDIDKIKSANNAGNMINSHILGQRYISKSTVQFPNNVRVPPLRTSVEVKELNQLPPELKSGDIRNLNNNAMAQTSNNQPLVRPPIKCVAKANLNNNNLAPPIHNQSLNQAPVIYPPNRITDLKNKDVAPSGNDQSLDQHRTKRLRNKTANSVNKMKMKNNDCCWARSRLNRRRARHFCIEKCVCCCKTKLRRHVQIKIDKELANIYQTYEGLKMDREKKSEITKHSTKPNDTEETRLPTHTKNGDTEKKGHTNIFEYALAFLSTCPGKISKLTPARYFEYLYRNNDHSLGIKDDELILTTTKIPQNFTEFLAFRRHVWRELKIPTGLEIDIEPNGRVNLYSNHGVTISNELLEKLLTEVHKFYRKTGIPTDPKGSGDQSQKETADKEIKKNIDNENLTRLNDINLSKNEHSSTVNKNSIVNNSQSEHQAQQNSLDAKVISEVAGLPVNVLTPVPRLSVLYYAYYRNGLFFKLNLKSGSLNPVQLNIRNGSVDEPGSGTTLRSTSNSEKPILPADTLNGNRSVPQNIGYFESVPITDFLNNSKLQQNNTRHDSPDSNIPINNSAELPTLPDVEDTNVDKADNVSAVNLADCLFEIKEEPISDT